MTCPKIAVLGLSHGYDFVEPLQNGNFAKLVAVADVSIETALKSYSVEESEVNKKSKLLDVKIYKDYKDLLNDIGDELDGIIAALPNNLHVEVTEEVASRGINLLLEKPIACKVTDAKKICDIVEKSRIKFMVGHQRRFSKQINCVRDTIRKGLLGEIIGVNVIQASKKPDDYFNISWRIDKESGGPLLINAIHNIDDLRYIIGDIDMVQAYITNKFRGHAVEDSAVVNIKFKNGSIATIFLTDNSPSPWSYEATTKEYSYFYPSNVDCYFFFGTKASLSFPSLELFSYDKNFGEGWLRPLKSYYLPVDRYDILEEELKHFCELIKGKVESRIDAYDALETLRVIEAIKESYNSGKSISL